MIRALGGQALLLARLVEAMRAQRPSRRAVLAQLVELGSGSVSLVAAGMAFFGTVIVTIAWAQARKYTGNITVVGPAYLELIIREFAPLLTGLLAASRQAAAQSAELGSMAVNEQVEALEMSGAEPLVELVAPRLLASLVALPALTVIGAAASIGAAVATVDWVFGADGSSFANTRYVGRGDVACALVKAVLMGAYIPLAAAYRGLGARGGAGAVGAAVTSGVVEAAFGCLAIDFLVAAVFLPVS